MISQTGTLRKALAASKPKGLANDLEDIISLSGRDEWAEECSSSDLVTGDANPRKLLIRQVDASITGGVLELDVVPWPVLLDQGVFEEQGLYLGVGYYEIKVRC